MTVATDGRTIAVQRRMSLAEYLDYDDGSDRWYELEDGLLIDISGENPLNSHVAVMLLFLFYRLGVAKNLLSICKRDYEYKPREYADRGIPEMWIVDPDRAWVQVGTLVGGVYQFQTFEREAAIVSPTFPALNLTAAIVLAS